MQQIDSTTFTANGLGDVRPDVVIGGKDKIKFIPNINMSFLGGEFFINLNRRDKTAIASAVDGKAEIGGIDKDIFHIDEQGRFKWDIEFASRPAVNSWTWELKHTKGIEFYYQPALTAEEIAEGSERPEEVVGSYAVYCNKANNKYKTGKLCHVYRPFCYDAKGNTIYADLKIADGQLTITIDSKWLDSAVYPVRLDPTIGYTSTLASSFNAAYLRILFTNMEAASDGDATAMYVYGRSTTVDRDVDAGYYNDNGSGGAGTVAGSTAVTLTSTAGWRSASVTGSVTGGNDYPTVIQAREYGDVYLYYDDAPTNQLIFISGMTTIPDNPTPSTPGAAYRIAVYLEYTESGGGSIVPIILAMNHFNGGM